MKPAHWNVVLVVAAYVVMIAGARLVDRLEQLERELSEARLAAAAAASSEEPE